MSEEKQPVTEAHYILEEPDEPTTTGLETLSHLDNIAESLSKEKIENPVSTAKQNSKQTYQTNASINITTGDQISLPADLDKEAAKALLALPNINIVDNSDARDWADSLQEGLAFNTMSEVFVSTLEDPNAHFRQHVTNGETALIAGSPKFKHIENSSLKGERAILRAISHLGMGTVFQVPLWHSGIWISFKPPTDSEIIELSRLMISDKINFGRNTYGLAFSNTTSYSTDRVVDFALSHIYDMTAKSEDISIENVKNFISSQDIPSLIWGFICTMYPKGFRYKRACISDPEKCTYVVEDTINVSKLQWTNEVVLTDWQKTHMSSRQSKTKDLASINRYKEELTKLQKRKVDIVKTTGEKIVITIKTPTITEYIDAGHRWIGGIVSQVEKTAGYDIGKKEKDDLITKYAQASSLNQYVHWIEVIEFATNIIEDKETIEETLKVLSADNEIRNGIIKAVVDFINTSTISVIGIPVFECPNCGKPFQSELANVNSDFKNIIPLDMLQVFFALVTQRLESMTNR